MTFRRHVATLTLLLGIGAASLFLSGDPKVGVSFTSSAHAQNFLKNLIARLRGQRLPNGIVKAVGRVEANQVDVSSKYPGQLAEVLVEEGTNVAIGQVIARVSSPEFEAQLRAARSDLQSAQDALAGAEADIASRKAALEFAKSDFERGQELMKSGFITKQVFEERQRNYELAEAAVNTMAARRDQARASITAAEAEVQRIEFDDPRSYARVAAEWTGPVSIGTKRGDRRGGRTDRHDFRPHRPPHGRFRFCG